MAPLLILTFLSILGVGFCDSITPTDVDCLLEFKKGIQKDPLGHLMKSWDRNALESNGCPQNWHGIDCDDGWVTVIRLNDLGLVGDLKFFTLYGLRNLRELSLGNNYLTGRLVPAIGMMSSLQHLDLSNNQFYGPIPWRLTQLWSLTHLNLSMNNFTGSVPDGMENLQMLRVVDLHSNSLLGDVGDLLVRLRNPSYVDLSYNMLTGSLAIDSRNLSSLLSTVEHLNLSYNSLDGKFFLNDTVEKFTNLKVLDVSYNQLSGMIPGFDSVFELSVLRLRGNQLVGEVPRKLLQGRASSLVELDISSNNLSGHIGSVTSSSLKVLNLSSNSLTGPVPSKVGSCSVVDLSKNVLSGNISALQTWGSTVEIIDLGSNTLSGTIESLDCQFSSLTAIRLRNNSLEGDLPSTLGSCLKLTTLDLSLNQLSGTITSDILTSLTLKELHLSDNRLTGTVLLESSDVSLSSTSSLPYSRLELVDFSNNLFYGSLPAHIGKMSMLRILKLGKNNFTGQIPHEIGKLDSLKYLDLSLNHLDGSIPDDLPSSLKVLNVSYNNLSGTLPKNLMNFPVSSFYPGNRLLVIPSGLPNQQDGAPIIHGGEGSGQLGPGRRVGIIVGAIGSASLLILLLLIVYHRRRTHEDNQLNGCDFGLSARKIKHKKYRHPSSFSGKQIDLPPPQTTSTNHDRPSLDNSMISETQKKQQFMKPENTHVVRGIDAESVGKVPNNGRGSPAGSHSPLHNDSYTFDQPASLYSYSPDRLSGEVYFLDSSLVFSSEALSQAPAEVLGRSSHGTSYKATVDGEHTLVIKWLREGLVKRKKDFEKEARKLGAIKHPNIVSLRGYYWGPKEHEKLIISDYISSESLANLLYGTSPRRSAFSFRERLQVAIDIARCLCYLHHERRIPHGNLKPTNILVIDSDVTAKVTDCSLHRLMTPSSTPDQILNLGALGYRAPELATTSKPVPSLKADVYSFGVILLELLTGKSAGDIVTGNSGAVDLTDWVQLCASQSRVAYCYDRELVPDEEEHPKELDEMLTTALQCIQQASRRPDVRTVLEELNSIYTGLS